MTPAAPVVSTTLWAVMWPVLAESAHRHGHLARPAPDI
jgi:hypothetical protein